MNLQSNHLMKITLFYAFVILCLSLPCEGWKWPSWGRGNSTDRPVLTRGPRPTTTVRPGRGLQLDSCPLRPCWVREDGVVSVDCPLAGCSQIPTDLSLPGLQVLYLQENEITSIPALPYPHLKKLDLSDNNISTIDDDAFKDLANLTMLYLSDNFITEIKEVHFRNLINLRFLYLQQNHISVLGRNVFFPALTMVERIDLSTNHMTKISEGTFSQLVSLKFLHLERNNITTITRGHFVQMSQLEQLVLNQNSLQSLAPFTFRDLVNLQNLDLSYNQLRTLPNNTFQTDWPEIHPSKLQVLNLNNNLLDTIEPEAFKGLNSLQALHMAYNPLKEFPEAPFPPSLEKISLHHMKELHVIPAGAIANLPNLRRIELYGNPKLSVVSSGSFQGPFRGLKLVDLSRNNLRTMPQTVLENWKAVASVDLSGNPWHCDCKIGWMKEVYMDTAERQAIRCQSPSRLSGRTLDRVPYEEMACGIDALLVTVKHRTGILLLVATSLVFVALVGLFLYKCRRQVFPCRYGQTSAYSALYSPKPDEDDDVIIGRTITVSDAQKKALQAEAAADAPAPVAL